MTDDVNTQCFFLDCRSGSYVVLLEFIETQDLMMRTYIDGVELFVFTSKLLSAYAQSKFSNLCILVSPPLKSLCIDFSTCSLMARDANEAIDTVSLLASSFRNWTVKANMSALFCACVIKAVKVLISYLHLLMEQPKALDYLWDRVAYLIIDGILSILNMLKKDIL